jgi:hypothetical protein
LAATPERPWIVAGAFVVWIAYAGLNVGLDNIKLKLAPGDNNAPYLAVYYSLGDLINGVAAIGGGLIVDRLTSESPSLRLYAQVFLLAWIGRTMAAGLLARLIEPGSRKLRDVLLR